MRRRGRDRVPGSRKALFAEKHKADRQLPSTGQTPPPSGASRPSNLTARRRTITIPSLLIDTGSTYATPPSTSAINHDSPHYDGNPSAYSPNDWSSSVTFSPPPIPSRLPITDPRLSYLCPPRWFPPQPPARKPGTPFSLEQLLLPSAQGLTLRRPQLEQFTESSSA